MNITAIIPYTYSLLFHSNWILMLCIFYISLHFRTAHTHLFTLTYLNILENNGHNVSFVQIANKRNKAE